jgi:hypothetical protein
MNLDGKIRVGLINRRPDSSIYAARYIRSGDHVEDDRDGFREVLNPSSGRRSVAWRANQ